MNLGSQNALTQYPFLYPKISKPDLVLVKRQTKEIAMLELTFSLPQSTKAAHNKKQADYTELELALTEKGYTLLA